MMGYTAPSKKAIKDAIKAGVDSPFGNLLLFRMHVQETSFFGSEAKVPGENLVVGPDAYNNRKWYGTLTVNEHGIVTGVK